MYKNNDAYNDAIERNDFTTALSLLIPIAEAGDDAAAFQLGFHYEGGYGTARNRDEAVKWWLRAAKKGPELLYSLGELYEYGIGGIELNQDGAIFWFKAAAEQGDAKAQYKNGQYYREGREGVPENYRAAVEWFRRAADQGYLEAQNALGDLYDAYVGANLIEVHKWYNLAAIAGDSKAERKRDEVEKKMTLEQVFEAQKLAAEWKPKLEVPDTK